MTFKWTMRRCSRITTIASSWRRKYTNLINLRSRNSRNRKINKWRYSRKSHRTFSSGSIKSLTSIRWIKSKWCPWTNFFSVIRILTTMMARYYPKTPNCSPIPILWEPWGKPHLAQAELCSIVKLRGILITPWVSGLTNRQRQATKRV